VILYLDTSAIVKLYISEAGSELVHQEVEANEVVATSIVAYPEALSALNRAFREQRLAQPDYQELVDIVRREWNSFLEIQIDQTLKQRAGDIVRTENLRGFDSIHLASALVLKEETDSLKFACFDERLQTAAQNQNLDCVENT